jgi:DNA-binding NarL/FixJ family response regulator
MKTKEISAEGLIVPRSPISVVVAEDCLLVRDSLCRALSMDPNVSVVGVAVDYDSTVELLDRHKPALLVTDVRMPPTSTDEGINTPSPSTLSGCSIEAAPRAGIC